MRALAILCLLAVQGPGEALLLDLQDGGSEEKPGMIQSGLNYITDSVAQAACWATRGSVHPCMCEKGREDLKMEKVKASWMDEGSAYSKKCPKAWALDKEYELKMQAERAQAAQAEQEAARAAARAKISVGVGHVGEVSHALAHRNSDGEKFASRDNCEDLSAEEVVKQNEMIEKKRLEVAVETSTKEDAEWIALQQLEKDRMEAMLKQFQAQTPVPSEAKQKADVEAEFDKKDAEAVYNKQKEYLKTRFAAAYPSPMKEAVYRIMASKQKETGKGSLFSAEDIATYQTQVLNRIVEELTAPGNNIKLEEAQKTDDAMKDDILEAIGGQSLTDNPGVDPVGSLKKAIYRKTYPGSLLPGSPDRLAEAKQKYPGIAIQLDDAYNKFQGAKARYLAFQWEYFYTFTGALKQLNEASFDNQDELIIEAANLVKATKKITIDAEVMEATGSETYSKAKNQLNFALNTALAAANKANNVKNVKRILDHLSIPCVYRLQLSVDEGLIAESKALLRRVVDVSSVDKLKFGVSCATKNPSSVEISGCTQADYTSKTGIRCDTERCENKVPKTCGSTGPNWLRKERSMACLKQRQAIFEDTKVISQYLGYTFPNSGKVRDLNPTDAIKQATMVYECAGQTNCGTYSGNFKTRQNLETEKVVKEKANPVTGGPAAVKGRFFRMDFDDDNPMDVAQRIMKSEECVGLGKDEKKDFGDGVEKVCPIKVAVVNVADGFLPGGGVQNPGTGTRYLGEESRMTETDAWHSLNHVYEHRRSFNSESVQGIPPANAADGRRFLDDDPLKPALKTFYPDEGSNPRYFPKRGAIYTPHLTRFRLGISDRFRFLRPDETFELGLITISGCNRNDHLGSDKTSGEERSAGDCPIKWDLKVPKQPSKGKKWFVDEEKYDELLTDTFHSMIRAAVNWEVTYLVVCPLGLNYYGHNPATVARILAKVVQAWGELSPIIVPFGRRPNAYDNTIQEHVKEREFVALYESELDR